MFHSGNSQCGIFSCAAPQRFWAENLVIPYLIVSRSGPWQVQPMLFDPILFYRVAGFENLVGRRGHGR